MTTFLVTRHAGALDWVRARGFGDFVHVPHLDLSRVCSGDTVLGTLPAHVAAKVCERGAAYQHLVLDLPADARGRELSAEDMELFGAKLESLVVLPAVPTATDPSARRPVFEALLRGTPNIVRAGGASLLALATWWAIERGKSTFDQIAAQASELLWNWPGQPGSWAALTGGVARGLGWAAVLMVCVYGGFRLARRVVRPTIRRSLALPKNGRRAVVVALSHAREDAKPELARLLQTPTSLFIEPSSHNWIQLIRALNHHLQPGRTIQLHVLTSDESRKQVEDFGKLVEKAALSRGASVELNYARPAVDFTDYIAVQNALSDLVEILTTRGSDLRFGEICLDSTGGTKITSIAMAVVSLNHDLEFTYVSTAPPFTTAIFDARLETFKISPS